MSQVYSLCMAIKVPGIELKSINDVDTNFFLVLDHIMQVEPPSLILAKLHIVYNNWAILNTSSTMSF